MYLGIHGQFDIEFQLPWILGEPGIERKKVATAHEIVQLVMERLVNSKRLDLSNDTSTPLVVLLNNLGSTSQLEMSILQKETLTWLSESFHSHPLQT